MEFTWFKKKLQPQSGNLMNDPRTTRNSKRVVILVQVDLPG